MDLQRYRHFIAVVDDASFTRAANRLGISQPPLSQSIRRLEQDLGVVLFERMTRAICLTKAGKVFEPEVRVSIAAVDRAAELARGGSSRSAAPDRLRLGRVVRSSAANPPDGTAARTANEGRLRLDQ